MELVGRCVKTFVKEVMVGRAVGGIGGIGGIGYTVVEVEWATWSGHLAKHEGPHVNVPGMPELPQSTGGIGYTVVEVEWATFPILAIELIRFPLTESRLSSKKSDVCRLGWNRTGTGMY